MHQKGPSVCTQNGCEKNICTSKTIPDPTRSWIFFGLSTSSFFVEGDIHKSLKHSTHGAAELFCGLEGPMAELFLAIVACDAKEIEFLGMNNSRTRWVTKKGVEPLCHETL